MAIDRGTLHITHLADFIRFAAQRGWAQEPTKGDYEALRLRHPQQRNPIILYRGFNGQHCTFGYDQIIGWKLFRQWQKMMQGGRKS